MHSTSLRFEHDAFQLRHIKKHASDQSVHTPLLLARATLVVKRSKPSGLPGWGSSKGNFGVAHRHGSGSHSHHQKESTLTCKGVDTRHPHECLAPKPLNFVRPPSWWHEPPIEMRSLPAKFYCYLELAAILFQPRERFAVRRAHTLVRNV